MDFTSTTPARRVLVIDDEAPIRLLCRINLEAHGMEVEEASDGATGLQMIQDRPPDVVLLDVMMPGLDGWSVAARLLADKQTRDLPIIFLTARAEIQDRMRGIDAGGIDYITKPFDPLELPERIEHLLERVERGERMDIRHEKLAELASLLQP